MALLTREQIDAANDIDKELVPVPEWGGEVLVWTPSGAERDHFDARSLELRGTDKSANLENFRARLAALCIRDEGGERLYSDDEVAILGRRSCKALDRVYEAARRLTAVSEADIAELTKNFKSGPSDVSGSDSLDS